MKNPFRFFEHEQILAYKAAHPALWENVKPIRKAFVFFWRPWLKIWRASGAGKLWAKVRFKAGRKLAERNLAASLALDAAEIQRQRETMFPEEHRFSILVPLYNTPLQFLKEMILSVQEQTYPGWELCLADGSDDAHPEVGEFCLACSREDSRIVYRKLTENRGISENTNACIDMATGDYLSLFDHDDLLHPAALYEVMKSICEQQADFVYTDEMVFRSPDRTKIIATHFKPDFAYDNLMSNNYICHLSTFSRKLLEKAGPFRKECDGSQDHDIILRLTGCAEKIVHIPKILYYWRSHESSTASDIGTKTYAIEAGQRAVRDFLREKEKIDATVTSTDVYPTMYHVNRPVRGEPSVEVIIYAAGTADNEDVLRSGAEALRKMTAYHNLTVSVVGKTDETTLPQRLNEAVRSSKADYLVFLHGEVSVQNEKWLQEMLMLAQEERIGAVGGKVQFSDGTVRHAGLITGLGSRRTVGRSHFRVDANSAGYFGQLAIVEDVSAVSAEFMMVSRQKLDEADGLDEQYLETLFDADMCLKLAQKGLVSVYTPFALAQGGSIRQQYVDYGRETEHYLKDAARFRGKWADVLQRTDPYYNPNLSLDYADYRIRSMKKKRENGRRKK
ncbi:glycosyltransferase [Aristaeella hokkaidonensis]|uniref:Glycosyltransferase n=1 Tax=Aristaeella hokkaidonensis TaxID=3046382 RepID=A0AC61N7U3_9FIRM|nr:glycosyltransferase [Aristaeella hokkaidonensis]QUC66701.1 glycosyltransferase [Aristaeella hokkaidonensis]SNT94675.1 Glycosyltransferase like family protein [Aristaeella hokkaidonensis]